MSFDPNMFKQVMAQWTSGIAVVTTTLNGSWKGITVSSFFSVSLTPPLVAISIDKKLHIHSILEQSGIFAVNILSADQVYWGKLFAGFFRDIEDRFAGINCHIATTGSPILSDVIGWLDCQVRHAYNAGDHTIYVGEVIAGDTPHNGMPLVYHNRSWGEFVKKPED